MTKENSRQNAIEVRGLYKTFKLPHEQHSGLKQFILNFLKRKHDRGYETQEVLKDISFDVKKGDFFGIVGRNGSGKSTLLKLISGIYTPDRGGVTIHGSLTPFIELGVGFNPELTGRENVFLNGALLGFSADEVEQMYDEIVKFAELERFMDQKLKNYSSGMQVRLAFSIAIRAETDILVLDEVLAVGDEAFQRKCEGYFEKAKKSGKTIVLVTHSMESVRKYCNRAMLIQDGEIAIIGNPDVVADEYYGVNLSKMQPHSKSVRKSPYLSAEITSKKILRPHDTLIVRIKYKALNARPVVAKAYIESRGQIIMVTNPNLLKWKSMITRDTKQHTVVYSLPLSSLNTGEYRIIVLLEDVENGVNIGNFGYNNETLMKVNNPDKSNSVGVMVNQASMNLTK